MEKKAKSLLKNTGNAIKDVFNRTKEKAILKTDQNDDGKLDMADVAVVAGTVKNAVEKGVDTIKRNTEESRKHIDLKVLRPIFPETLDQSDFLLTKFIMIKDRDKKHEKSDACKGSIGFLSNKSGLNIVTIYKDSLNAFGLSFYPDDDSEFYYVNPADRNNYIALDEYFDYLKIVRVNELQRVAQSLGAKHFKVTYKEERMSFSDRKGKIRMESKAIGDADGEHSISEKKYSVIDVAAEMYMDGHVPQKPELVYLLKDDNVNNLIHLRMTGGESFHNHKISIKMSNSSGIKEKDALKIDAALKGMKVSGNTTVTNEAKNESRRYLEYEIDF